MENMFQKNKWKASRKHVLEKQEESKRKTCFRQTNGKQVENMFQNIKWKASGKHVLEK